MLVTAKNKKNILLVGAGQCSYVAAHKLAQHISLFGNLCIASRKQANCDRIISSILSKEYSSDQSNSIYSRTLDAMDTQATIKLIQETSSSIVLNLASTFVNIFVLEACIETGASYLDTALYEEQVFINKIPWYANHEWKRMGRCKEKGITAILGVGFCPGVINAYCAFAAKHDFDSIDTIDMMVANNAGENFAIGNNAEVLLREFNDDEVAVWINREWCFKPMFSERIVYDFPVLGKKNLYLSAHDEIHSLYKNISANSICFWAGYTDYFVNCITVLKNLGLLSPSQIKTKQDVEVIPLHVVLACMPKPEQVNTGTRFKGVLIKGEKDGRSRERLYYNILTHEHCFKALETNSSAYVNGTAAAGAVLLVLKGIWDVKKMVNVEELDPDPFIELLTEIGLPTEITGD